MTLQTKNISSVTRGKVNIEDRESYAHHILPEDLRTPPDSAPSLLLHILPSFPLLVDLKSSIALSSENKNTCIIVVGTGPTNCPSEILHENFRLLHLA